MQFVAPTVRYRPLSDKDTNPSTLIYDLYVQGLVRLLKMFSLFLIFYSSGVLIFRIIECVVTFPSQDIFSELSWAASIFLHGSGVVVGVFGLRAAMVKSRGTSRNFFLMMVLFDVIFLACRGYSLYLTVDEKEGILNQLLGKMYALNVAVYYFILAGFALVFITVKAYRFYILLSKLIIKLKRNEPRIDMGGSINAPEEMENGLLQGGNKGLSMIPEVHAA
jgi:hypothetical protein